MKRLIATVTMMLLAPAAVAAERAIEIVKTVDAPVAAVWKAWIDQGELATWFGADAKMEPRVGGAFEIYFDKESRIGCNGCTILAIQPERMLSFTWNAPPHLPEARAQFTHVTVRLEAVSESKTCITFRQDGWGDGGQWDEAFDYFRKAWPRVLANLEGRFAKAPAAKE